MNPEVFGNYRFPDGGSVQSGQAKRPTTEEATNRRKSPESTVSITDLIGYDARRLQRYITRNLLGIENGKYSQGNGAFEKLAFLVGREDGIRDVGKAVGLEGNRVWYKEDDPTPKDPEVPEFMGAITSHFRKKEGDIVPVLSEFADVIYNLTMLRRLDPDYAPIYAERMKSLTKIMGFNDRQALLMAAVKYHTRLVTNKGFKDIEVEDEAVAELFKPLLGNPPVISHIPTNVQLGNATNAANELEVHILIPRMKMLRYQSEVGSASVIEQTS